MSVAQVKMTGLVKTCGACGRKGSVMLVEHPDRTKDIPGMLVIVWDRTATRDVDLDVNPNWERFLDAGYRDGYCK